jgi:thiamine-phosphate pyrophosphorylase
VRLPLPFCLLAISDAQQLAEPLEGWLGRLSAAGIKGLQWREKGLPDRELLAGAHRARASFGGTLLINGRCDVAVAVGAQGVHLPVSGLPLAPLRRRWPRLLLGRSTHGEAEVAQARDDGADYVTFGPVYDTPSKAPYGAAKGLQALSRAAALGVPVLALGGVTLERLEEVAAAGAAGVAGIRLFMGSDPELAEIVASAHLRFASGRRPHQESRA